MPSTLAQRYDRERRQLLDEIARLRRGVTGADSGGATALATATAAKQQAAATAVTLAGQQTTMTTMAGRLAALEAASAGRALERGASLGQGTLAAAVVLGGTTPVTVDLGLTYTADPANSARGVFRTRVMPFTGMIGRATITETARTRSTVTYSVKADLALAVGATFLVLADDRGMVTAPTT